MKNKNESAIRKPRIHRTSSLWKITIFAVLTALVTVIIFGVLFVAMYKPSVGITDHHGEGDYGLVTQSPTDDPVKPNGEDASPLRKKDFYTFLLMGRDTVGLNTDIIMLIAFDVANKNISVMQIPRDTYMEINSSPSRINAAYSQMYNRAHYAGEDDVEAAGMSAFAELLGKNLNIHIDFYALMNLTGFRNIIDIIGGVEMDVPYNMNYSDPDQNLYINIRAGPQTLDGKKAEGFVRYRSGYVEADIGRINAQKIFLSALIKQVQESLNVTTAIKFVSEAIKNVKTSMSLNDMIYFAKEFYSVDSSDITFISFPGTETRAEVTSGAWYYIMHRADAFELVNRYFNVYNAEIAESSFDKNRAFTDERRTHINKIYLISASDNLDDYIHSAKEINDDGLEISLLH